MRRLPARAAYDRRAIDQILDEAMIADLGFVDEGQPFVIPTLHARVGDTVYFHGSAASRAIRTLSSDVPACLTVTLIDGFVLARSVFHSSVNYRSVVVLGTAPPAPSPTGPRNVKPPTQGASHDHQPSLTQRPDDGSNQARLVRARLHESTSGRDPHRRSPALVHC